MRAIGLSRRAQVKIIVAGEDRSADLGRAVSESARGRAAVAPLRSRYPDHSALTLGQAESEEEYLRRFVRLLGVRHTVDTGAFRVPPARGVAGRQLARLRAVLWKLLRYQHDGIVFQQNVVNEAVTAALEFENDSLRTEVEALKQRVAVLENRP
jgi:hypothetical protein